jgi:hypothetical protein
MGTPVGKDHKGWLAWVRVFTIISHFKFYSKNRGYGQARNRKVKLLTIHTHCQSKTIHEGMLICVVRCKSQIVFILSYGLRGLDKGHILVVSGFFLDSMAKPI